MACDTFVFLWQVTLDPGDVLFVPKKWWHYVQSLDTSISINTWIELVSLCHNLQVNLIWTVKCVLLTRPENTHTNSPDWSSYISYRIG